MIQSFAIQKIILQRKEKIDVLKKTLNKTSSSDSIKQIKLAIKEQEKELFYFENMGVAR